MYQNEDDGANALKSNRRKRRRFRFPMIPIRSLANVYGRIAYAIGPERWIPRVTQRVLCSVRTREMKIALTFDDGPNPEYTPLLLTKLAKYRVSATFFLIGRNLKSHPEIGRRIVQEGHEVGNHTYNHPILPFLSRSRVRNELGSTQELIAALLNVEPVFLRPPNGLFTKRVLDTVEQLGYRAVVGDVFPVDVALPGPEIIIRRVLRRVQPGSIIILHDGYVGRFDRDKSQTVRAMDGLIPRLCDQGYKFVTLSDLVSARTR
jgi:peptidoglycan-N-acetylglucosamine deacetylase